MNRRERRKIATKNDGWGPWEEAFAPPVTEAQIIEMMKLTGKPRDEVEMVYTDVVTDQIRMNLVYQVAIRKVNTPDGWPKMLHLSIKRRDKKAVGVEHFRDFQRIKNELVGPENEAVELYPAESRLADSANQYHLWVITKPGPAFPFGFKDRFVQGESGANAVQRPFDGNK